MQRRARKLFTIVFYMLQHIDVNDGVELLIR
jgi:hypothetical protein